MADLLKNKLAVITGAARGIGRATAILFAKEGAKVFLTDLDEGPLSEIVGALRCNAQPGDVTKESDVQNIMKKAAELGNGSIDILCNIAGITRDAMLHKMTLDQWNFILNVNLTGTFLCTQAASPYMRDVAKNELPNPKRRSVINVSSISGKGNIGQANYAASKAGIEGLTKTVAKEWASFNITCNAVAPGYIDTRLTQIRKDGFGLPESAKEMIDKMQKETGLKRESGKPEDIANVILFFASDLSSFITGQVITVAGGLVGTI